MDPHALRNRPTLEPRLQFWKQIFLELKDSRQYSQFGQPLPLPISELHAYCKFFDIKELSERQALFRNIRAMDASFVDTVGKKLAEKSGTDTPAKP